MKKLFVIIAFTIAIHVNAQVREGTISYNLLLENSSSKAANPMMGNSESIIYFKNGKTLSKIITKAYTMKVLSDDNGMVVLSDVVSGKKIFSRKSKAEIDKVRNQKNIQQPKVEYTKKKKMIMGYECTKAFISFKDPRGKDMKMTVWYTEKIKNFPGSGGIVDPDMLLKLKGMALEMDMEQGPIKMKMTVKNISTKPVPDAVFALSTVGYTEMKPKPAVKSAK